MRNSLSIVALSILLCTATMADDAPRGVPAERKSPDQPATREVRGDKRHADPNERPAEPRKRGDVPRLAGPFEKIAGLTDEQKARLLAIRTRYEELMRKEREEMMAVLTDAQRQEFAEITSRGRRVVVPRGEEGRDNGRETRREAAQEADRAGAKVNGREGVKEADRDGAKVNGREGAKEVDREGVKTNGREGARDADREGVKPAAVISVEAKITKVEVPSIWVQLPQAGVAPVKVTADEKTVITIDGKVTTFAELKVGQQVTIEHPTGIAAKIAAHSPTAAPAPAPAPAK